MSYLIVPAGPQDAAELARVHVASWRETYGGLLPDAYLAAMSEEAHARRWAQALTSGSEMVLAAVGREGLVGYAAGGSSRRRRPAEAEVQTLYLLASVQGQGLGRDLLAATARVLAAQGARSLMISVLRDNVLARGFYERLGGTAEAPRREPSPGGGVLYEVSYVWDDIGVLTG